jgi:hypothetical protein
MRDSLAMATLAAAAVLTGCATPHSEISGDRYHRAPIDTYPLQVIAVDGVFPLYEPARVDPGARQVTVRALPTRSQHIGTRKTVPLDVKACTLYYLVAVKETELSTDFEVKVDYEEPVPGCTRPR